MILPITNSNAVAIVVGKTLYHYTPVPYISSHTFQSFSIIYLLPFNTLLTSKNTSKIVL